MFKLTQKSPKLTTGPTYAAFKKTMDAAEKKALAKEVRSINRTISNPLQSEGSKQSLKSMMAEYTKGDLKIPGVTSSKKGGRSRRKLRKKRRKRKTKRKKSRRKRKKSRRKRRR